MKIVAPPPLLSYTHVHSSITESSYTRQIFSFQKFQGCSASCTAMGDLVFRAILLACSSSVAASDYRDGSRSSSGNNSIHERLSANLEFRHLEYTIGPFQMIVLDASTAT